MMEICTQKVAPTLKNLPDNVVEAGKVTFRRNLDRYVAKKG